MVNAILNSFFQVSFKRKSMKQNRHLIKYYKKNTFYFLLDPKIKKKQKHGNSCK